MQPAADPKERIFFAVMLAIAVGELWVLPARSSFWLDETATFWVIKDGLAETLARPMYWSGQSPLYYLAAWLALAAGGPNEFVLRLPSLVAMALAAWLLFRLAVRLFDRETAVLAALVFVCSEQVVFAASDARPYALGLCLLTGAAVMLVRWVEDGRPADWAGYVLLAALTIYAHYLFATGLAVQGGYALYRVSGKRRRTLCAAWLSSAVLAAPLVSQFLRFYRTRASHSFAETPRFGELLAAFAPPVLVGSVALGLLVAWLVLPAWKARWEGARESVLLAAGWALAPLLFCFLVSQASATKLFVPRYYMAGAPGMALLAGWLLRSVTNMPARRIAAVSLVLGALVAFGAPEHGGEDWAGAMRAVRETAAGTDMPVLVASGFVEASEPEALARPEFQEVLFAPLTLYPPAGRVIPLPFRLTPQSIAYLERVLPPALEGAGRFVFVGRWQGLSFEPWLRGRMAERGFRSKSLGNFGNVGVFLFEAG